MAEVVKENVVSNYSHNREPPVGDAPKASDMTEEWLDHTASDLLRDGTYLKVPEKTTNHGADYTTHTLRKLISSVWDSEASSVWGHAADKA